LEFYGHNLFRGWLILFSRGGSELQLAAVTLSVASRKLNGFTEQGQRGQAGCAERAGLPLNLV
jgi:hypothetical protein